MPQSTDIVGEPRPSSCRHRAQSRIAAATLEACPGGAVIAWLLVLPVAGWVVLRAFGLEEGYPMVPLLAYTPLAVAGALAVFVRGGCCCGAARRRSWPLVR